MTTRAELREALRRRLEDRGSTPLWEDDLLHDCLGAAIWEYGIMLPWALETTVTVPAGATSVAVDAPGLDRGWIDRVLDPSGAAVPRRVELEDRVHGATGAPAQSWRWWGGTLQFERPAAGGDWRVEYLGARALPADDTTPVPIVAGDEEIVLLLAAGAALRKRAVEDAKRGIATHPVLTALADAFRREGQRLLTRRRRRLLGGWLGTA